MPPKTSAFQPKSTLTASYIQYIVAPTQRFVEFALFAQAGDERADQREYGAELLTDCACVMWVCFDHLLSEDSKGG